MKSPAFGGNWDDPSSWLLQYDAEQLRPNFISPLIGNGLFSTRIGELVAVSDSPASLLSISKIIFDNGPQRALPEWARLHISVDDCVYSLANGRHELTHTLDLRTGEAALRDNWEYRPGCTVEIAINLLILRNHRHGATLRAVIRPVNPGHEVPHIQIGFGLHGAHVASDYRMRFNQPESNILLGQYETAHQSRSVCQGLLWHLDTATTTATSDQASADLNASTTRGTLSLNLFYTFHTYAGGSGVAERVMADLRLLSSIPREQLEAENLTIWKSIWSHALAFPDGTAEQQRQLLINQFNLLTSLDDGVYPLGACGLGQLAWGGYSLWDADLWIFRSILPLWPKMARAILDFRFKGLEAACHHAHTHGLRGAWFPWCTGEDGESRTKPDYVREIHTGIWIALGCHEYHQATGDESFLRNQAWPLVSAIADFYVSWAESDTQGRWHINGVIGPDEAVTEAGPGHCNDHYLINLGVRHVLSFANQLGNTLGYKVPLEWAEVERNIVIPSPSIDGIIPEYQGYQGEQTKQADVILAFGLLKTGTNSQHVLANIDYYRNRTWGGGPLMTSQIEAWLLMKHDSKARGLKHLFDEYAPFVRGLHGLTFECRPKENKNSNFLTAISGQLLALIFGYYDYQTGSQRTFPQLGDFWN